MPDGSGTRILVVDDEDVVLRSLGRLLDQAGYHCTLAADATEARRRLADGGFGLVLSDVNMPGESGLELARSILSDLPGTAVVMVTGVDDTDIAGQALSLGAYGYVIKPFERNEILINVANALRRRQLELDNQAHREQLERMVAIRTADLRRALDRLAGADRALRHAYEEAIWRLAHAVEYRDETTGEHLRRMSRYTFLLARRIGLGDERCDLVRLAGLLHDVGKIGIPDDVLHKPGALSDGDWAVMRRHPLIGHQILAGSDSDLLRLAADIALTHHERYDGTGYPSGIAGTAIPLEGRIVAIADTFDALTTARPYKDAFGVERSLEIVRHDRGRHFDPDLVDVFLEAADEVVAIATDRPHDTAPDRFDRSRS